MKQVSRGLLCAFRACHLNCVGKPNGMARRKSVGNVLWSAKGATDGDEKVSVDRDE